MKAADSSLGRKISSNLVTSMMKTKIKSGMAVKKRHSLQKISLEHFGKKFIPNFRGVYMLHDTLPQKPLSNECGIINLDSHFENGIHWVAYKKPPVEIIKYLGIKIRYNDKRFQKFNTFNCGHLCMKFLLGLLKL